MSDPGAMLENAAEALIRGDVDEALKQLSHVEKRLEKSVPSNREDLKHRLDRLVSLAQAAAQGIEDAREIITGAGTSARIVTTYDRCGDARKVHVTKPALGRF
jgi:hypothetical protein